MDGKIVPIPPSQETVNTLFGANVHTEEEMEVRPSRALLLPRCVLLTWLALRCLLLRRLGLRLGAL